MLRYGIIGSLGTSMFSFLRTSIMFSLVGVLTYVPTNSVGGFPFLRNLCRLYCCRVFNVAILINVRWYLIVPHLICLSLRTSDAEHSFMCFMAISMTSLEKYAFILWPIFYWVVYFWHWAVLMVCMCWRGIPYRYLCLQEFFFHSEGCLFLSLMVSFAVQMLLMFIRSHLFLFYFDDSMRWIKKELASFYVKACALFLKSFIVSVLLFRSLICMELIFVYGVREHSNFILIFIAKEPARCPPRWLLPISIPSVSVGGFPLLYTLSSIYYL